MNERDRTQATDQTPLVIVVDDDESMREALMSLLKSAGFRARDFATAREYLLEAGVISPACLILDVRMPEISGLELQRMLIERSAECPIVFISAYSGQSAQKKALAAGAVDFILKPFDDDYLLEAVSRAIVSGRPR